MIKKIKIGSITYKVMYHDQLLDEDDNPLNGQIDFDELIIHMDKSLKKELNKVILIHECIHGILNNAGQEDHDEQYINIISYGIMDLIKNNKSFIRYLMDEKNEQ